MPADDAASAGERPGGAQDDLRRRVGAAMRGRAETIAGDAAAVFPYSGAERLDADYCYRVGHLLTRLLVSAVLDDRIDLRGGVIGELRRLVLERALTIDRLFTFMYLVERTAVDELALDASTGATSESWPVVAQLVRRASFDVLAACSERACAGPTAATLVDPLTTLYTRPVLEAVLAKVVECAGRFGDPISLILFDVDRLSAVNQEHGYGVGDRILERLGILMRTFFRQHDWVARHGEDSIAVVLSRADHDQAADLAELARATVEERLALTDHRTDRPIAVTVSVGVVNADARAPAGIDPVRLMADAEAAVARAKRQGRNRVERTTYPYSSS
jgi:diguanylate cyclase (GGDEF)-like protein